MKKIFLAVALAAISALCCAQVNVKQNQTMSNKVLVLLAHPDMEHSNANKAMANAISDLEGVKVVNIAKKGLNPEDYIEDVKAADVIVYQFPMWWGAAPAILKEWQDKVLIAYMENPGLKGKKHLCAVTTGSPGSAYRSGGYDLYTIDEILRPYQLSAVVCGMVWQSPFALHGAMGEGSEQNIKKGAEQYRALIQSLVSGQ